MMNDECHVVDVLMMMQCCVMWMPCNVDVVMLMLFCNMHFVIKNQLHFLISNGWNFMFYDDEMDVV